MSKGPNEDGSKKPPESGKIAKISRGVLQVIGEAVPFAGGVLLTVAGESYTENGDWKSRVEQ